MSDIVVFSGTSSSGFNWANQIGSIISATISLALIIFGYFQTRKTLKVSEENTNKSIESSRLNTEAANKASMENTVKTLNSKRIEERKAEIYKKLNDFYSPFFQLRQKSQLLYDAFVEKHKLGDENFKTLIFLLNGGSFTGNDKILLGEIVRIGDLCEKLIIDKAGLIDNEKLRDEWFPKASMHFLIMRLAFEGKLKGEPDKFEVHTFPIEMDDLVKNRIKELDNELKELDNNPIVI